jgi:hypothetical protein
MQVCHDLNRQAGRVIDVYGVVTNGEGWKFYRLSVAGQVYETLLHGIAEMPQLLGIVRAFFQQCEKNLEAMSRPLQK